MYVQDMEKILAATYKNWKETEKNKDSEQNHKGGPRKGLPVGLCFSMQLQGTTYININV